LGTRWHSMISGGFRGTQFMVSRDVRVLGGACRKLQVSRGWVREITTGLPAGTPNSG